MHAAFHRYGELFDQLGLPSSTVEIRTFIAAHAPLPGEFKLEDAPFWTPAQAQFLREAVCEDSDWAALADQLNAALRQH